MNCSWKWGGVFTGLGSQRLWSYSLVVWNRSSNVNKRMVCAHSLPWLGAFLYYTKIRIYSGTGRHLIWPDVYYLPDHTVPLSHQHLREEQLHEVHVTWWASVGEPWHIQASSYLPRWMSCCLQERWSSDRTKPQHVFLSTSISHLWSILHLLKLEFYLWVLSDEVQNSCHELPPT